MTRKANSRRDKTAGRRSFLMNVLYPICRATGKILRLDGEKIDDYFIEKNNQLVSLSNIKYRPEEILLVFPHCLQDWECPHRITADVRNCQACGNCSIPKLVEIGDRYGVSVCVVGGGTAARRAVQDHMPSFIIAVACERDMISGIQDTIPLPLCGILNERPNGPCRNTLVDIGRVEEALVMALHGK